MKNRNRLNRRQKLSFGRLGKFPRVMIIARARQKLQYFIDLCSEEISGLGVVERKGNDFLITDVFLFEQTVTGVSTELEQNDLHKFLYERVKSGLDSSKVKLWWHSHNTMETFWSGTDQDTIKGFENGYMISLEGNKSGEFKCRIDLYTPFQMTVDDLPLITVFPEDVQLKAMCRAEIKEKIRTLKYVFENLRLGRRLRELETEETGIVKILPDEEIKEKNSQWLKEGRDE